MNAKVYVLIFLLSLIFIFCSEKEHIYNFQEEGIASYYANLFIGLQTANGELFSQDSLTAAHKTLPFGSMVLVKNIHNEKEIIVRINDRGPFRKNRVIDLTRRAADSLGFLEHGLQKVIIYTDTIPSDKK